MAISFDVVNAFNSLSWSEIRGALETKNIPSDLRAIANNYLEDHKLIYINKEGRVKRRVDVLCGAARFSFGIAFLDCHLRCVVK